MIATDLARALDPVQLATAAGLAPDPWQAAVLRSAAPRVLLNCSRQSGKSTIAALLALHTAAYQPDALCLMLSPTLRQSGELFRKAKAFLPFVAGGQAPPEETALTLRLPNGARIVSLPGKEGTIRGYSAVTLLVIDEAARVPTDLYASVRPMLAVSGGRLAALSTPFGTRGWWYESWQHGGTDWERYHVTADQCPRIAATFLAEEAATLGEYWYRQEYYGEFLDAQSQAFPREAIDRAFTADVEEWEL